LIYQIVKGLSTIKNVNSLLFKLTISFDKKEIKKPLRLLHNRRHFYQIRNCSCSI